MNDFEKIANENDRKHLNYASSQEFAFEFVRSSKICTATIPKKQQSYFKRRLEKFLLEGVEGVRLRVDGEDCQVWDFPVKFLRLNPPPKRRELSEEEKRVLSERFMEIRKKKKYLIDDVKPVFEDVEEDSDETTD